MKSYAFELSSPLPALALGPPPFQIIPRSLNQGPSAVPASLATHPPRPQRAPTRRSQAPQTGYPLSPSCLGIFRLFHWPSCHFLALKAQLQWPFLSKQMRHSRLCAPPTLVILQHDLESSALSPGLPPSSSSFLGPHKEAAPAGR